MAQPARAKHGNKDKHLTSINFPLELLKYIDDMASELDMNRSSLVCLILEDFKKSGKTIKFVVD